MGAWSQDAFGNDDACDWAHGLTQQSDLSLVDAAIDAVIGTDDGCLEAPVAAEALAAIEVLARLRGHSGLRNSYSAPVDQWVQRTRLTPSKALLAKALTAIERIVGKESELKDLWDDSGDGEAWVATVAELKRRLLAAPQPVAPVAPDAPTPHPAPGFSSAQTADTGDQVGAILRRVGALDFSLPPVPANAMANDLLRVIHAGGALGAAEATRHAISRIWQSIAHMGKEPILWDLAVREAQTWAGQGRLDEALEGLEAWRASPAVSAPGEFDNRASGVCLIGCDPDRARVQRAKACEAMPDNALARIDRALLEARLGSSEVARDILAAEALDALPDAFQLYITFVRGILACRNEEAAALPLLTEATLGFLDKAEKSPAAWPLLSVCGGWWALALGRAGRNAEATALLRSIAPIVMLPNSRPLLQRLQDRGLLPEGAIVPALPTAPASFGSKSAAQSALQQTNAFKAVRVRGVNALQWVHLKRREFAQGSRLYPFLIGNEKEYAELLEQLEIPADGGQAGLAAARELNVAAWIKKHGPKAPKGWPKDPLEPHKSPLTQFNTLEQNLKMDMIVGLVELDDPAEMFVRLGFGGWNGCPEPHVHTALHAYWRERHGAEPIALQGSIVECIVARPPSEKTAALALAAEHQGYCDDIVEQGVGSAAKLATTLLNAGYWYFWWD